MPLSEKDRHTIETLFKEKGWSARKMCAEMPGRGWATTTVHDVIQKVRESGTSDRRPGSGRPATAMTEDNKEFVVQRSMSDKERPGTSLSERQMAGELGISQSSVGRIKKALNIKTFTRIITPRMTAGALARRGERAEELHVAITEEDVPNLVFYDEKDLTLERPINRQTDRVCGRGVNKCDVSPERLFHETSRFSRKIMVCGAVSERGKSKLVVLDPQRVKVDSATYQSVLKQIFPSVRRLYPEGNWIWVQDSAPSHGSRSTQDFLTEQTPSFIPADAWPPNSPDLNPLDYHVWAELKERVYAGRSDAFGSLEELEAAAKEAWREIPMENIRKSISRFRGRVELVATHDGGPIQHIAR
jgi:hypothetical protein